MPVDRHQHDGHDSPQLNFADLENQDYKYLTNPNDTQGDILYRGASEWTRLAAGTAGYFLSTNATSTAPTWTNDVATPTVATEIANKGYVDNLSTGEKIFATTTAVTVSETTTETDIFSATVPAGTLGTNNVLKCKLWITDIGATNFLTFRIYYAVKSTQGDAYISFGPDPGSTADVGILEFSLAGDGTTSTQRCTGSLQLWQVNSGTSMSSTQSYWHGLETGTKGSRDSTSDQTLTVAVTFENDSVSDTITVQQAELYKLTD